MSAEAITEERLRRILAILAQKYPEQFEKPETKREK